MPSPEPRSTTLTSSEFDIDPGVVRCQLFLAGDTGNSQQALANLARLQCSCGLTLQVQVIDIHKHPERAISDKIVCTPTLIVRRNYQEFRVIGNLSDEATLLEALGADTELSAGIVAKRFDAAVYSDATSVGENDCTVDYLRRRLAQLEQSLLDIRQSQLAALWADDMGHAPELAGPEADRLYCRMVEGMSAGVVLLSAAQTVLYANQQAALMLDRSRNALVGRPLLSLVSPACAESLLAIRPGITAHVQLVLNDREPISTELLVSNFLLPMRPFSLHCQLWQVDEPDAEPDAEPERPASLPTVGAISLVPGENNAEPAFPVSSAAGTENERSRRRLLLIGRGVDTLKALALLATRHHYETRVAHSAVDAHTVLDNFIPDVVCLEMEPAGIDGFELHRAIEDRLRETAPVFIALTCGGKSTACDRCLSAGFAAHFTKPFNASELFTTIKALLTRGQTRL